MYYCLCHQIIILKIDSKLQTNCQQTVRFMLYTIYERRGMSMTENELMSMIIDEITEYRLSQYRKENADEYSTLLEELARLSAERQDILKNMDPKSAEIIEEYNSKTLSLADKDCAYLYTQGAKDCVKILKRLCIL